MAKADIHTRTKPFTFYLYHADLFIMKLLLFVLPLLLFSACTGSLTSDQRKKIKENMKQGEIKKVSVEVLPSVFVLITLIVAVVLFLTWYESLASYSQEAKIHVKKSSK